MHLRGRIARKAFFIVLAGSFVWLAGLAWFASTLPESVSDPDASTDLIVVLTGGSERLKTGLTLLEQGKAGTLLISGVHPGATFEKVLGEDLLRFSGLRGRVVLDYAAVNTVGNAAETARWMEQNHFQSVRLVTAAYHMPRSLLEFRDALPPSTMIVPHPVFPPAVQQKGWWKFPGTTALIAREYSKYITVRLRMLIHNKT